MRTIIQIYLKQDELQFLDEILKIWKEKGYYLKDNHSMPISGEHLFIFARKEDEVK